MIYKIKLPLLIFAWFFVAGCSSSDTNSDDVLSNAKVKKLDGLYIFIEAEPVNKYDRITEFKIGIYDKILSLSSKTISQVSADLLASLSFDKNLMNTIDQVKVKYPEANGIIFNEDMSNCIIIKLR